MHASHVFAIEHPEAFKEWYHKSNYLAFLAAKSEHQLLALIQKAEMHGIRYSLFREPDLGNQITAICLESSEASRRLCGNLPLALKNCQ